MKIAFDAKRYYHNQRGLGNYSRDVIRLLRDFAPDWELLLVDKTGIGRSMMRVPQCDIYHGLSGELPFTIEKSRKKGTKTIVTVHDAIFVRYPELYSPTYRWLFTEKVRFACQKADTIIAISEQTKRDLMEFFHADESKIRVVYQGCNNAFRQPLSDEDVMSARRLYDLPDHYLLDVGAIEPRKNLVRLIEGMAAAHIDMPLVAIGSRSRYADMAAARAHELGVKLIMKHDVAFADFPAIYKGAEMMCYPSVFEGFGIPILEAMCAGIPVLTSVGSCFEETGGKAALYAHPDQPEEIGAQIHALLTNDALREQCIAEGYRQANLFSDERVAHNLMEVYEQLVQK